MGQWEITLNGKEIKDRRVKIVLMPILWIWCVLMIFLGMLVAVLGIFIAIIGASVGLVLDPILKRTGRKGFIDKGLGYTNIKFDLDGFRRR